MEQPIIQPIQHNLWWAIPTKLAGVRKPTAQELEELRSLGIGAIVSVMDDPTNLDLYQQEGFPHLWLPILGGTAPSLDQIEELQQFVELQNHLGHGVAIHCTNGRRRTGTIVAAYLLRLGFAYEDAIQTLKLANPDIELREAQTTFLRALVETAS